MTARIGLALLLAAIAAGPPAHGHAPVVQNVSTRSTVVLSDLHMGMGRSATGEWQPTEDFRWTAEFARFLEATGQEGHNDIDLIMNGDTFELVSSEPGKCGGSDSAAGCTETAALARLDAILKAHDPDLKALGQFARAGSNHVVFVPGDQDAALATIARVIASDPDDPFAYTSQSIFYQRKGLIPEAEKAQAQARMASWKQDLKKNPNAPPPDTGPMKVVQ